MLLIQSDPDTLKTAEKRIRLTVVELEHLSEKKSIQILHGAGRPTPGSPMGWARHFSESTSELASPIHGWSGTTCMFYLFSKSNFPPLLPLFTCSASSPLLSPLLCSRLACPALLFFLFTSHSQVSCDIVPSHTEGDFNYVRTQKHIE